MGVPINRGPSVGRYKGRPMCAWIEYPGGGVFRFVGVADTDEDGGCPLEQLERDEIMIAPGLIYVEGERHD
jgi:hypothetical protein